MTSKLAQDDRTLELAAESGCTMLSIGFESISRETLKSVHKHVNRPGNLRRPGRKVALLRDHGVRLVHVRLRRRRHVGFDETVNFNINAKYDACAYSVKTPYPGTLTWYEMKKANRIVSFDWEKYDQGHVVLRPAQMSGDELRLGQSRTLRDILFAGIDREPVSGLVAHVIVPNG